MHGYVLRKRLHETLGMFRIFSYDSVYPTLRRLLSAGPIVEVPAETSTGWHGVRSASTS